jgi:predicted PurR-regulated permease PerM
MTPTPESELINDVEIKIKKETTVREPAAETEKPDISDLTRFLHGTRLVTPVAVIGLFVIAFCGFLFFAKPFLMPVVLAILLNFLLKPVVTFLRKLHVPEAIGGAVVLFVFLTLIWLLLSRLIAPINDWAEKAPEHFREVQARIHGILRPAQKLSKAAQQVQDITKPAPDGETQKVEIKQTTVRETIISYVKGFVGGAIETLVLLYFLLAAGDLFLQKLVRILPHLREKKKAVEITHEVQENISIFLLTITGINICLGLVVGISMWAVGMNNPSLWGVMAALLNYIPYFGPITGVLILGFAGLTSFAGLGHALIPPAIYLSCHALESNFITPMVLGRRLTLNPVVIFMSLIFWTWLWGIPGALMSIPMLMMAKVFCDHFKPLAPIGELLSG